MRKGAVWELLLNYHGSKPTGYFTEKKVVDSDRVYIIYVIRQKFENIILHFHV